MSFSLHTELTKIEVPFEFADIPVPSLDATPPASERVQAVTLVASETNTALPDGLRMDVNFGWEDAQQRGVFRIPGSDPKVPTASIELTGPMARGICRFDSAEVTKCVSERGDLPLTLPVVIQQPSTQRPMSGFGYLQVLSSEGKPVECKLDFARPDSLIQTCRELEGELAFATVLERETITIDGLGIDTKGPIQHPTLEQVGVSVQYEFSKQTDAKKSELTVTVNATDWANWDGVKLGIVAYADSFFFIQLDGDTLTYTTSINDDSLTTCKLEIQVNKKVKREKVPFRFLNVPISAASKP